MKLNHFGGGGVFSSILWLATHWLVVMVLHGDASRVIKVLNRNIVCNFWAIGKLIRINPTVFSNLKTPDCPQDRLCTSFPFS